MSRSIHEIILEWVTLRQESELEAPPLSRELMHAYDAKCRELYAVQSPANGAPRDKHPEFVAPHLTLAQAYAQAVLDAPLRY